MNSVYCFAFCNTVCFITSDLVCRPGRSVFGELPLLFTPAGGPCCVEATTSCSEAQQSYFSLLGTGCERKPCFSHFWVVSSWKVSCLCFCVIWSQRCCWGGIIKLGSDWRWDGWSWVFVEAQRGTLTSCFASAVASDEWLHGEEAGRSAVWQLRRPKRRSAKQVPHLPLI